MNTFNTLKATAAVAVLSFSLIGAANAANQQGSGRMDGGLMKEMMSPANQVQPVVNQTAQANLDKVQFRDGNDKNGGLMEEMSPIKVQDNFSSAAQDRLDYVELSDIAG